MTTTNAHIGMCARLALRSPPQLTNAERSPVLVLVARRVGLRLSEPNVYYEATACYATEYQHSK